MRALSSGSSKKKVALQAGLLAAVAAVALAACGSSSNSGSAPASSTSAAAGGGSSASTGTGSSGTDPIVIGNVGGYSGFAADISKASYFGLQAWADDTNANGGLLGHQIKVVFKDDASTPATSVTAVKGMVQNDKVIALVGNHESGVDGAWASYIQSQNIPVVGGVATGTSYSTNPDFFPVTDTNTTGSASYVNAAKLAGKTSSSVAYCAEVPACAQAGGLMKIYTAKLGLSYIPGQPISASATNYTAQCEKYKSGGAQSVFAATDLTTAGRLIAACAQSGYTPLWVDNPQNWNNNQLTNPVWNNLAFGADAPLWFGTGPQTTEFLAAMKKYEPSAILNTSSTSGWFAGEVFAAALKAANPTGPITAQTVLDGLYKLGPNFDLSGAIAGVTYTKGKAAVQADCAWYASVKDGKLVAPQGYNKVCLSS
jgi:branched-chain amino acid transport system substrate-binding protein